MLLRPSHPSPSISSISRSPLLQTSSQLSVATWRPIHASRRIPNFRHGRSGDFVNDPRSWRPPITPDYYDGDVQDDYHDGEDGDRSLDLFIKFINNVFRKVSKRARKAVRSVLPPSIPSDLVAFSVNGVLLLALLWVFKAFLEVVCTLGSVVFISILVTRGLWMGITYLQESRNKKFNGLDDDPDVWSSTQPAV